MAAWKAAPQMIVLHAAFEDSLLIWAESSKRRKGSLVASFDAGAASLVETVVELGVQVSKRHAHEAVAWLPSTESGPMASAALLDDDTVPADSGPIAPWIVTAIPLDLSRAVHLLAACAGKRLLRPGLVAGADITYWAAALRFAAGLVMRGQFLPDLTAAGAGFRARWQPVVSGPDMARMHELAQAMPAVARAVVSDAGDSPPEVPAQTILVRFIESAVDALARSAGARKPGAIESIHDQWLNALTSGDGKMRVSPSEGAMLASQAQQWQRPIQVSANAPFRLCFRLEEPQADEERWLVRYLLQGSRDPSLILPTSEAWSPKAGAVREHLLASLGQAAGIYPPIEASLRERAPEGCSLDVNGAHEFLRETASALEQSGFGVMLPGWWTRKGSQTRLKARPHVKSPKLQGGSGMSLESIVTFDWQLALGDETISTRPFPMASWRRSPTSKRRWSGYAASGWKWTPPRSKPRSIS